MLGDFILSLQFTDVTIRTCTREGFHGVFFTLMLVSPLAKIAFLIEFAYIGAMVNPFSEVKVQTYFKRSSFPQLIQSASLA